MRLYLAAGLISLFSTALPVRPSSAMQFEQILIAPAEVIVGGRGPIVRGDSLRLEHALSAVPRTVRLLALALDSPGGNVAESELLAGMIRAHQLAVLIPPNSKCVSACFLLLAASPRRFAAMDALIGVHSASENGAETDGSLAMTTLMARDAAEQGIPSAIIAKMVQTAPGRIEWLDQDDLALMGVTVFEGDARSALLQASTATMQPLSLSGPSPPGPSPPGPPTQPAAAVSSFAAGRDARLLWNAWVSVLDGPYREGAKLAEAQLGLGQPGSCYGPGGVNRGDSTQGCTVARQRLAPIEAKVRTDAGYAAGWRSVSGPLLPGDPQSIVYRGAYFCGRQIARLTMKIWPPKAEERRRAVVSFAPQSMSPEVPSGSFIAEGLIDAHGGRLTFVPVRWVSQPDGYRWFGLNGLSIDDGKTFGGAVTGSSTCSNFTLQQVSELGPVP